MSKNTMKKSELEELLNYMLNSVKEHPLSKYDSKVKNDAYSDGYITAVKSILFIVTTKSS